MKRLTRLFRHLEETIHTDEKVAALEEYFTSTPIRDAVWALHFLMGRRLPRSVTLGKLRDWIGRESELPPWLLEECHRATGDWAETLALLLPAGSRHLEMPLHDIVEQCLLPLGQLPESAGRDLLVRTLRDMESEERFVCIKLSVGAFRVRAVRRLVTQALARVTQLQPVTISHRLMGNWRPTRLDYQRLVSPVPDQYDPPQTYPFYFAYPLDQNPEDLGLVTSWLAEWKWDGIRAQLIHRQDQTLLWTREEELVSATFPEITEAGRLLPDGTVLDGEVLAWRTQGPLPSGQLQRRLSRKSARLSIGREVPVCFMAYDILESEGTDCRLRPLCERRLALEKAVLDAHRQFDEAQPTQLCFVQEEFFEPETWRAPTAIRELPTAPAFPIRLSPALPLRDWADLVAYQEQARHQGAQGIMLKHYLGAYGVGRQHGPWWKCKVQPFHVDAVLIAAQTGRGRGASLYTDYTFGVWDDTELVPVAKVHSGLTNEDISRVNAFVRENTVQRRGPVRFVEPKLVFRLAFEEIHSSARHKAGLVLRAPRMKQWRHDKTAREADTLETLRALLHPATLF